MPSGWSTSLRSSPVALASPLTPFARLFQTHDGTPRRTFVTNPVPNPSRTAAVSNCHVVKLELRLPKECAKRLCPSPPKKMSKATTAMNPTNAPSMPCWSGVTRASPVSSSVKPRTAARNDSQAIQIPITARKMDG